MHFVLSFYLEKICRHLIRIRNFGIANRFVPPTSLDARVLWKGIIELLEFGHPCRQLYAFSDHEMITKT